MEDIDPYVGMFLENPAPGALVGKTFLCIIGDQFARLKLGDRYFYDLKNQAGSFTLSMYLNFDIEICLSDYLQYKILYSFSDQLNEIRKTSLARIICDNTQNIDKIQPLVLYLENKENNPKVQCNNQIIPSVDISYWKQ